MVKVGIIGGSGLEDPNILHEPKLVSVLTPYGAPSDDLLEGTINGVECVLLARHGRKHDIMPGNVNYRANLWALYSRGVDVIIASTACGSLQEHVEPGHLLFPDSVFDRTNGRASSFFDGSNPGAPGVCHIQGHPTYNEKLRQVLISTAERCQLVHHRTGFGVCIEGPRFSTRTESNVFRSWGASLVNMTMMPECILAKELGIPYATTALVTDYDCWKEEEQVTASSVMQVFAANVEKAKKLFVEAVGEIGKVDWSDEIRKMKKQARESLMISPDVVVPFLTVTADVAGKQ
uniref:S-methyl-5'-thioadenosine phosphorylase n=1 Tax=Caenorhabditis japonica TaxID=281687 RepID=A0A8R1I1S9_CAEJA